MIITQYYLLSNRNQANLDIVKRNKANRVESNLIGSALKVCLNEFSIYYSFPNFLNFLFRFRILTGFEARKFLFLNPMDSMVFFDMSLLETSSPDH